MPSTARCRAGRIAGVFRGRDAALERMQSIVSLVGPIEVMLEDLIEAEDGRFVALVRMVGEASAGESSYTQSFAVVHRVRDGRVAEADYYLDPAQALDATGITRGQALGASVRPMLALLYDIHGNLAALDAVLADCPAERFLLGGRLRPRRPLAGRHDRPARRARRGVDPWQHRPLAGGRLGCSRTGGGGPRGVQGAPGRQPRRAARGPQGGDDKEGTVFCHASPGSDMVGFPDEPSEQDEELTRGVEAERVIFGHTHPVRRATPSGIRLVNPGSVGLPFDHDHRAAYALLHDDGRVELRRVEYDWRPVVPLVRERMGEPFASRLEQARFDAQPSPDSLGRSAPAERPRTARPPVLRPLRGGRGEHPACRGPARGDAR